MFFSKQFKTYGKAVRFLLAGEHFMFPLTLPELLSALKTSKLRKLFFTESNQRKSMYKLKINKLRKLISSQIHAFISKI